ncbi:MAG TPA: hypothetical protein VFX84_00135 [Candidatus Saccharimonadales bacterium]|nr:hypothetical protein [Candidatus Saccharimonadales bacterium]
MDTPYWTKQTAGNPLFPDLLWSRPENKRQAGKLLVIGGNAYGFAAAGEAYAAAGEAGIGTARALLPDSLQKTVGKVFEAGEYAPSTPSGSFSRQALAPLMDMARWADGILLAGDLGRNSETAVVLEQFAHKYDGQLALTKDAADYFIKSPSQILGREDALLVLSFAQLQKIAIAAGSTRAFKFDMDLVRLVETLHGFTERHKAFIITKHLDTIFVAVDGQVSTTKLREDVEIWRVRTAAHASVWWLQNPAKPFEALTTSVSDAYRS